MIILGAGLSGLIAGNMLRRFKPVIYEAQPSLPNNHAALLRFRSDAVSNACAIPFKKVKVQKAIYFDEDIHNHANIKMMNLYSEKVTDRYSQRSIEDLRTVERYISPPDFISQAAQQLSIKYSDEIKEFDGIATCISTVPMDKMMDIVGWKNKPEFKYKPIWALTADINEDCELYQTIYFPGSEPQYRVSITGKKLIAEFTTEIEDGDAAGIGKILSSAFGIHSLLSNVKTKMQKYGKLLPIDDRLRKEFMLHLTKQYNIYSLGRFATWRQILLDDVVQDVNVIEQLMTRGGYDNNKHWSAA